ncbi:uncharacterized protein LOC115237934 isoform X1 [Formica exsecta]|uniref:uncharacterized protein LOC115237934 isoform X1 n=1 Tax=Formica exsecta TaxID=72781 RepID=UPI0011450876|nr:uncharacterized protein LOC115237934 isoform X1 [Formica exsecta]XP_029667191.1 uncharacterized protein LOC115237934 isoform X1 [Formica exsecta]XP_029667192.1 uncharacterized protein LOC115237934 isoform X1 [Formica exsecta]
MMEAHARAPDPLTKSNDMASNWHSWKEDFIIFMKVTGYIDKPNEIRANLLKNRIGKIGIDAIQAMSFDNPQDKDDMNILIAKLEEFFNPPKNEVVERFQFFTRDKKQNETIEQYINILKEKAKTCNFNDITDSIIRDKIILGTPDKILRKKYLETKNLDLQKLVAIYNDYNINTEKMKEVTKESTESISSVQKPPNNDTKRKCWRCNCQHPQGKCPAWGSKCTKCGDVNHFTQCCKGPNFKPNLKPDDNKINNLLNPMEKARVNLMQQIGVSKTGFPDIPTVSYDAPNSTFCNDFVMIDGPNPNLRSDNASGQSKTDPNPDQEKPNNDFRDYINSIFRDIQSNIILYYTVYSMMKRN